MNKSNDGSYEEGVRVNEDGSNPCLNIYNHHHNGDQNYCEGEKCSVDAKRWKIAAAAALKSSPDSTDSQDNVPMKQQKSETKHRRVLRLGKKHVQPEEESQKDGESLACSPEVSLPQFVFQHKVPTADGIMRDSKGHTVLQILPAIIDSRHSADTYTTAVSIYLDQVLNDAETKLGKDGNKAPTKFTLLLDVRPGRGWPNQHAGELVGFIRHVAHELHARYPDNLSKCYVFPVPRAAVCLWYAIRPFLDNTLRKCMHVVQSSHGVLMQSPPPHDKMIEFMLLRDLEILESFRLSCYR